LPAIIIISRKTATYTRLRQTIRKSVHDDSQVMTGFGTGKSGSRYSSVDVVSKARPLTVTKQNAKGSHVYKDLSIFV
jgi:hypothetical protein